MRVAYVSHSLVATRQVLFAAELRKQLQVDGGDLLEVYPYEWGQHRREGGWVVDAPGSMGRFDFPRAAWARLVQWEPDALLLQDEAYTRVAHSAAAFCRDQKVPLVTFSWENQLQYEHSRMPFETAAVNLFGNWEAASLGVKFGAARVNVPDIILPQVGVDPDLFQIAWPENRFDILFAGRNDPMKGEMVLDVATAGTGWEVHKTKDHDYVPYEHMGDVYNGARVQCTPSLDLNHRPREQFAPYTSVEGLFCGVPVVTTDQSAIHEWLAGLPGVWFTKQGDAAELRQTLGTVLDAPEVDREAARRAVVDRFSNEAVAKQYAHVLRRVVK